MLSRTPVCKLLAVLSQPLTPLPGPLLSLPGATGWVRRHTRWGGRVLLALPATKAAAVTTCASPASSPTGSCGSESPGPQGHFQPVRQEGIPRHLVSWHEKRPSHPFSSLSPGPSAKETPSFHEPVFRQPMLNGTIPEAQFCSSKASNSVKMAHPIKGMYHTVCSLDPTSIHPVSTSQCLGTL